MEICQALAEKFKDLWNLHHEPSAHISVQKAKKRLQKAQEHGCLLLDDCIKCEKVRQCPMLDEKT